jgi:hypothetical protein
VAEGDLEAMIEVVLAFKVCLSFDPSRCKKVELSFYTEFEPTPNGCMTAGGQNKLAEWMEEHPNWTDFRGWSCGRKKPVAAKI